MSENKLVKPSISVDLKNDRIRIHKNALHSIGDPDYVLLLVSPKDLTLAILRSNRTDPKAHRITKPNISEKKCCELYSRSLVRSLHDVCNDWQENRSYRLYGESIPNEGVVQFHMTDSNLVEGPKV